MIEGDRVIAAVPARGGSKTIPRKNLKRLNGKPLLAWSIEVGHETPAIDRTIVTTDDEEITTVARNFGAEVVARPPELAEDDSPVIDAIRHLLSEVQSQGDDAKYLVLLEPTSPFRTSEDVTACLEQLADTSTDFDSIATFTEAETNPHRAWRIEDNVPSPFLSDANPWLPRQELPEAYQLSGAVYAFRIEKLPDTGDSFLFGSAGAIQMPERRAIDIDTQLDFKFAEMIVKQGIHD